VEQRADGTRPYWRNDRRLRSENFRQRRVTAFFVATGGTADAERADHHVFHDDRIPTFHEVQVERRALRAQLQQSPSD
jgi:hypothetical protein